MAEADPKFSVTTATPVEKTWSDWMQDGRDWALREFHPKSSHIIGLENTAFAYAEMNAPVAVKRAHFAAAKAARDAEFAA